jgi:Cohesin domain/PEP-CTERM motif
MTRVQMFTSIIWIAVLFVVPACFAGTISLSLPPGAISAGDTFTVGVAASGYTDLYAFQFDLAYNPSILSAVSVSEGSFLLTGGTTFFIAGAIDNATGVVSGTADTLLGAITGVNGGGILASVQFLALAGGSSPLTLFNPLFLSSGLADIATSTSSDSVTINPAAGGTIPEPATVGTLSAGLVALFLVGRRRAAHVTQ